MEQHVAVFTTVFPHRGQPNIGLFIRERMFRVAAGEKLVFVVPVPWFPFQGLIRLFRPYFRPPAPKQEQMEGHVIHYPRYLSVPLVLKSLDGFFLAAGSFRLMRRLKRSHGLYLIDSHFGYPDGYGARLLGRWLGLPFTVTLRGNETTLAESPPTRRRLAAVVREAARVISVSESLRGLAMELGAASERCITVPNGVDTGKFHPVDRQAAREQLGIPAHAPVLVSVGALVERKGFHRVIDCLPALVREFPDLVYLIVGGTNPVEDWGGRLRRQVKSLGLEDHVRFLGVVEPERLKYPLSAADIFVLATAREGWANVLLEAMACGLPVVTTDVGGNAEVVSSERYGLIVPFGDAGRLEAGIREALERSWDREAILAYARDNQWDRRVAQVVDVFRGIKETPPPGRKKTP